MSEYKKEIGVAVAAAIALAVLVGGSAIYLFPGRPSSYFGGACARLPCVTTPYPTFASCSIQNGSCEITIQNPEPFSVEAVGCLFQHIYAIGGNGQTVTNYSTVTNNHTLTMSTVNIGTGVLSTQPKGSPLTTTIAVNSTATVYCTPSASVPTPTLGSQAMGEVEFSNQTIIVNWLEVWQK